MDQTAPDLSDLSLDQLVELERRAAESEAQSDGPDDPGDDDVHGDDDGRRGGPIVLPWWQHPFNIVVLVVTAAILAGMIGWMVGDSSGRPDHNDVDTGFLQDMRTHHEQAVLISLIYQSRPDIDPGLDIIAGSIIRGQNIEIGRMIQMLRTLGETEANETGTSMTWMSMVAEANQMPGIASDADLDELGRLEGLAADELFVKLMTAHHQGGIEMAEFAVEHGQYDEVIKMAEGMAKGQRGEIAEMLGELG